RPTPEARLAAVSTRHWPPPDPQRASWSARAEGASSSMRRTRWTRPGSTAGMLAPPICRSLHRRPRGSRCDGPPRVRARTTGAFRVRSAALGEQREQDADETRDHGAVAAELELPRVVLEVTRERRPFRDGFQPLEVRGAVEEADDPHEDQEGPERAHARE